MHIETTRLEFFSRNISEKVLGLLQEVISTLEKTIQDSSLFSSPRLVS